MEGEQSISFTVTSESWRFKAYCFFWGMCLFAFVISKHVVIPLLAKGPDDGSTCGPFNRYAPEMDVFPGQGFDFYTQSHMRQFSGYNNICSFWDYSPARELTAMVYPSFEISLLLYLVFDFFATALANKRGQLPTWFWRISQAIFVLTVVLVTQFRMMFVFLAYENVRYHTVGFLGFQIALILVTLQNTGLIWYTQLSCKFLGGLKNMKMLILFYVITNMIVCAAKLAFGTYAVVHGHAPAWGLKPSRIIPGKLVGQVVDYIWMIYQAILPLIISYFRSKREAPLKVKVTQDGVYLEDEDLKEPLSLAEPY